MLYNRCNDFGDNQLFCVFFKHIVLLYYKIVLLINAYYLFFVVVTPCDKMVCLNGGRCLSANGTAACNCRSGFSGTVCQGMKLF